MISPVALSEKIAAFLQQYANIRPDFDPEFDSEDEKFTSPDASILFAAQTILAKGELLPNDFHVDSSWGSGGYSPYTDAKGKQLHDEIVAECKNSK